MISPSGENNVTYLFGFNTTGNLSGLVEPGQTASIPSYIRTCCMVACIVILGLGVVGNVMVPLVILRTKDMRNSTNIFLMNLSLADLLVLLVCTPSILVEVNSKPETWVLGEQMCKAVPYIELTVAHASVLTILAISFERYYAICEPLRAGYVCTKARALLICLLAWVAAATFTSPVVLTTTFRYEIYFDGNLEPVCLMEKEYRWQIIYHLLYLGLFFALPLAILVILYSIIAKHLMSNPVGPAGSSALRYRRQVVTMLGAVVLSFFLCLLPMKVLTFVVIVFPDSILNLGAVKFYNILYFSRIMIYLNSSINPILYNLMSSKFREGFRRLLHLPKRDYLGRKGTITTTTTTLTSSSSRKSSSEQVLKRSLVRMISLEESSKLDCSHVTTTIKIVSNNHSIRRHDESYV